VLYPDCGPASLSASNCHKVQMNIGYVRTTASITPSMPPCLVLAPHIHSLTTIHTCTSTSDGPHPPVHTLLSTPSCSQVRLTVYVLMPMLIALLVTHTQRPKRCLHSPQPTAALPLCLSAALPVPLCARHTRRTHPHRRSLHHCISRCHPPSQRAVDSLCRSGNER
jgi:hypothetical protein